MIIQSARLNLIPLTPAFLEASLATDQPAAEKLLGLTIPPEWFAATNRGVMQLRLGQLRAEPGLQPWLLRAIAPREKGLMVGAIGFHTRPGAAYLAALSPGGVEFGYRVFEPFRRQGYASEASIALMNWAHAQHGVTRFVLSISPENHVSLGLAQKLGFTRIGAQIDEEDGPEDIFEWRVSDRQTV
ncbi:MAG TPA: GNAT family N-acetyltransferase [Caldilineaceae bacterium]|nr:GNAT family N-acetyltransferase [Caldilineaceae bacterium]